MILKRSADFVESLFHMRNSGPQYIPSPLAVTDLNTNKSPVIYASGTTPGYQSHYNLIAANNMRNSRDEPMQAEGYLQGSYVSLEKDYNDNERNDKKRSRDNQRLSLNASLPHVNSLVSTQHQSIRSTGTNAAVYGSSIQVMQQSAGYLPQQGWN